jgi:hypothetical protein
MSTQKNQIQQKSKSSASRREPDRPPRARAPEPVRRRSGWLYAWGAIGLVVAVVASLLVAKALTTPASPSSVARPWSALPAAVARDLQDIPASVFDEVGIASPAAAVSQPVVIKGTSALTFDGKAGVFYLGGEFCPFCAAQRWALTAALARFGTFSGLGQMASSSADDFPDTPTLTYQRASYVSPFVALRAVEHYSSVPDPATGYWKTLEPLTAGDRALLDTYDQPSYLPGVTQGQTSIPFIDVGNRVLVPGASYSPAILGSLTRQQIAGGLRDATNPVTKAIVSTANYLTASICSVDGQQPMRVCTSKGVNDASRALGLTG